MLINAATHGVLPQMLGFGYLSGVLGVFDNDLGFLSNFVRTCKNISLIMNLAWLSLRLAQERLFRFFSV